jgi:hypothetical protein
MVQAIELIAHLGRFNHSSTDTIVAVFALLVLMGYWILKT